MIIPCPVAVRADHKHAHPSEVQEHAVLPAPHHLLRRLGRRRVEVQHLGSARPENETVTVTVTVAVTVAVAVTVTLLFGRDGIISDRHYSRRSFGREGY